MRSEEWRGSEGGEKREERREDTERSRLRMSCRASVVGRAARAAARPASARARAPPSPRPSRHTTYNIQLTTFSILFFKAGNQADSTGYMEHDGSWNIAMVH